MTGERECATGIPMTPASPNPSACDMLRFHPRPHPERATCADAGCFLLDPAFRRSTILFGRLSKSIRRNGHRAQRESRAGRGLNGVGDAIAVARVAAVARAHLAAIS